MFLVHVGDKAETKTAHWQTLALTSPPLVAADNIYKILAIGQCSGKDDEHHSCSMHVMGLNHSQG